VHEAVRLLFTFVKTNRKVMKDTTIKFNFSNSIFTAAVVPSFTEKPYYFFILFNENEIINEFGDELSIITDGTTILNSSPGNNKVKSLKEIIFQEIQKVPEYFDKLRN
jgi:hypothetical protein